ncbi:hypothetical protein G9A89_023395 [Geosiphon pyriformis]|nr:hypothetical protein G9A89_023395 [Geosiphon pyriformis]
MKTTVQQLKTQFPPLHLLEKSIQEKNLDHFKDEKFHSIKSIAESGFSAKLTRKELSGKVSEFYGQPAYIEPQCFTDLEYIRDEKSDIYALGVLLWELSSRHPTSLSKAANTEDSFEQFFLGRCYDNRIGTSQDQQKHLNSIQKQQRREIQTHNSILEGAIKMTKKYLNSSKAAEGSNTNAQLNLEWYYKIGLGTTKNSEKAFELYSKATKADNTNKQYKLVLFYANKWGAMKNEGKFFELYSRNRTHN